jgi:uncharacterized membrane protein
LGAARAPGRDLIAGDQVTDPDPAPVSAEPPPARSGSNWTGGRVVALVFASIAGLIGIVLLLGGLALIAAHAFVRDDDGYYTTGNEQLQSDTYAISTDRIDLGADPAGWAPDDLLGTVRVRAESTGGEAIFVGIARDSDVNRYLGGVAHAELTDFTDDEPRYDTHPGRAPPGRPSAQGFWAVESEGSGEQQVSWDVESGVWSVVVMNADAARGIAVDADVGAKIDWLIWAGVILAVIGLLLTATAVILIVAISRRASRDPAVASAENPE